MSRTQKVWNQPGEAVNERPFQVRSIPASMMAAAWPARRVWPLRARSTRARKARPQSATLAGWSQSPSKFVDLPDGTRDGPDPPSSICARTVEPVPPDPDRQRSPNSRPRHDDTSWVAVSRCLVQSASSKGVAAVFTGDLWVTYPCLLYT